MVWLEGVCKIATFSRFCEVNAEEHLSKNG